MSKLSMTVVIGGRSYPLMVEEHEREKVKLATEAINQAIRILQDSYAVRDMQDLLAMTALQISLKENEQSSQQTNEQAVEEALEQLSKELDDAWSEFQNPDQKQKKM